MHINDTLEIIWDNSVFNGPYRVEASIDHGGTYFTLTESTYVNRFFWRVDAEETNDAMIRIVDLNNETNFGLSSHFSILPYRTKRVILMPVEGEIVVDQNIVLEWITIGKVNKVNIEVSYDDGATWNRVATKVTNRNTYTYTATEDPDTRLLFKVYVYQLSEYYQVSNEIVLLNKIAEPKIITAFNVDDVLGIVITHPYPSGYATIRYAFDENVNDKSSVYRDTVTVNANRLTEITIYAKAFVGPFSSRVVSKRYVFYDEEVPPR